MVHDRQFALSSPQASSTTSQTSQPIRQTSPSDSIALPTPPPFSGTDAFYIIIAISVLVRVIVSPPDKLQK